MEAVQSFLVTEDKLNRVNKTYVALVPKVQVPKHLSQLRPISLCNVIYKLGLKLLTNRLKPITDSVIPPCQGTFVPAHSIAENSIFCF